MNEAPHGPEAARVLRQCRRSRRLQPGRAPARHRAAGDQPANPQPRGRAAAEPAAAQRTRRRRRREAGKRLLEHARGILQQVDRARREVDETKDAPVGHVVVGLPPTVARHLTLPVVREFRQRYPGGSLSIVEGLSATIHEWLLVGRVDVGVVYNPVASPAVDAKPLLEEQLCLIGRQRQGSRPAHGAPCRPAAVSADHSEPAQRDPHAGRDAARGARSQAAGRDGDRRGAGDPGARRRRSRQRRAVAAGARTVPRRRALLCARAIVQPRLASRLAVATSAQRPSTPIEQRTIELIERLVGPALAVRRVRCAGRGQPRRNLLKWTRARVRAASAGKNQSCLAAHRSRGGSHDPTYYTAVPRRSRRQLPASEISARTRASRRRAARSRRPSCATVEDRAIAEVVKMQEDVGLSGDHRRRVPPHVLPHRFPAAAGRREDGRSR